MICNACNFDKFEYEFHRRTNRDGSLGRRAQCKSCNNQKRRETHIRNTYGISGEDFERMRIEQNNACKICRKLFLGRIDIDHDHKTGKVRGLLCISCNGGLGNFQDSIELLKTAIMYLQNLI